MKNYFQATPDSPAHISVGAVVVNSNTKVACHYFKEIRGFTNLFLLMRESLEANETLEAALARGLMEEWGMKATLITFLGTIVSSFSEHGYTKSKTTLYFLMKFLEQHDDWRSDEDPERGSTIEWHDPNFLIEKMKKQRDQFKREDADESQIIQLAQRYMDENGMEMETS